MLAAATGLRRSTARHAITAPANAGHLDATSDPSVVRGAVETAHGLPRPLAGEGWGEGQGDAKGQPYVPKSKITDA